MGFLERFIGRQRDNNDMNGSEANINRLGMTIIADEKMLVRLGIYDDMLGIVQDMNTHDEQQTLESIEDVTHKINNLLHQVAIPFGRAGDRYYYAEAMKGWSTLYTRMVDLIQAEKMLDSKKWELEPEGMTMTAQGGFAKRVRHMLGVSEESETMIVALAMRRDQMELIGKVFHFFTTVYLRYALLIAEISWYNEDVHPSWSTVIQNPTPVAQPRGQTSYQQPRDFNQETGGDKSG